MYEFDSTIRTLWQTVKGTSAQPSLRRNPLIYFPLLPICVVEFTNEHPEAVNPQNALGFVSDDGGDKYNLCHCKSLRLALFLRQAHQPGTTLVWSNFEIGDMDFWRGETYMSFFEFLDKAGGFYYEASSLSLPFPPSAVVCKCVMAD